MGIRPSSIHQLKSQSLQSTLVTAITANTLQQTEDDLQKP